MINNWTAEFQYLGSRQKFSFYSEKGNGSVFCVRGNRSLVIATPKFHQLEET